MVISKAESSLVGKANSNNKSHLITPMLCLLFASRPVLVDGHAGRHTAWSHNPVKLGSFSLFFAVEGPFAGDVWFQALVEVVCAYTGVDNRHDNQDNGDDGEEGQRPSSG